MGARRPSGLILSVRLWLLDHALLSLLTGGVLIGLAGLVAVLAPQGMDRLIFGTVTAFGLKETEQGSYPVAVVELGDASVTVRMPDVHNCVVGARIRVLQRQTLIGRWFRAEPRACAPN